MTGKARGKEEEEEVYRNHHNVKRDNTKQKKQI